MHWAWHGNRNYYRASIASQECSMAQTSPEPERLSVKQKEQLAQAFYAFGLALASGMVILKAVKGIADTCDDFKIRNLLRKIWTKEEGCQLVETTNSEPSIFDKAFRDKMRLGEEEGNLHIYCVQESKRLWPHTDRAVSIPGLEPNSALCNFVEILAEKLRVPVKFSDATLLAAEQSKNPIKEVFKQAKASIEEGVPVHKILLLHPELFPGIFVSFMQLVEEQPVFSGGFIRGAESKKNFIKFFSKLFNKDKDSSSLSASKKENIRAEVKTFVGNIEAIEPPISDETHINVLRILILNTMLGRNTI